MCNTSPLWGMHFGAVALPAKVWMPKEEKGAGFALSLRAISWPFPVEPYSSPRNGRGNGRERAKPKEEAPFGGVSSFRFALSLRAISWPFPVEPNSSPRNLQFQSDCFFRISPFDIKIFQKNNTVWVKILRMSYARRIREEVVEHRTQSSVLIWSTRWNNHIYTKWLNRKVPIYYYLLLAVSLCPSSHCT